MYAHQVGTPIDEPVRTLVTIEKLSAPSDFGTSQAAKPSTLHALIKLVTLRLNLSPVSPQLLHFFSQAELGRLAGVGKTAVFDLDSSPVWDVRDCFTPRRGRRI